MFFLPDNSYTRGFKFQQVYPAVEPFISQGLAGKKHIGFDAICNSQKGIATLAGTSKYANGTQGGHQCYFTPEGRNHLIRFLHLKYPPKVGKIETGEELFVTGNSGAATNAPHLHVDIYDYDSNSYLDPEKYNWIPMPKFPAVIKIKVVTNGGEWASLNAKMAEIKQWYETNSGGHLSLEFEAIASHFDKIEFLIDPTTWSAVINEKWFDANVLDKAFHTTILAIRDEDLPDDFIDPNTHQKFKLLARTLGYFGKVPTKMVIGAAENDQSIPNPGLNAFVDYVKHELLHCCFMWSFLPNDPYANDYTHKYYPGYPQSIPGAGPEQAFAVLNFSNIANLINLPLTTPPESGDFFMIIKEVGKPALYVAESGVVIPIGTDFASFQQAFPNAKIIEVTSAEFSKLSRPPLKIIKA